jgi:hypothetical protein
MKTTMACQCLIILSLLGIGAPTQAAAAAISGSGAQASAASGAPETRKPVSPGTATPKGTTRGITPTGKIREAPVPPDRAQEVEERVRSGRMEQPVAQGEISERLNRLESGSNSVPDLTAIPHSGR